MPNLIQKIALTEQHLKSIADGKGIDLTKQLDVPGWYLLDVARPIHGVVVRGCGGGGQGGSAAGSGGGGDSDNGGGGGGGEGAPILVRSLSVLPKGVWALYVGEGGSGGIGGPWNTQGNPGGNGKTSFLAPFLLGPEQSLETDGITVLFPKSILRFPGGAGGGAGRRNDISLPAQLVGGAAGGAGGGRDGAGAPGTSTRFAPGGAGAPPGQAGGYDGGGGGGGGAAFGPGGDGGRGGTFQGAEPGKNGTLGAGGGGGGGFGEISQSGRIGGVGGAGVVQLFWNPDILIAVEDPLYVIGVPS